jgi:hypothetical protein
MGMSLVIVANLVMSLLAVGAIVAGAVIACRVSVRSDGERAAPTGAAPLRAPGMDARAAARGVKRQLPRAEVFEDGPHHSSAREPAHAW